MSRDYRLFLEDILASSEKIVRYTRRLSENPAGRDCDRLQILMAALSSLKRPQRRLLLCLRPFWPCRLALKIFARSRHKAILGQPPRGLNKDEFLKDEKTYDAVVRNLS